MASGEAATTINRSADDVWKLIGNFGGLAEVMPGVDTCTVEGDVRTLGMMGMTVKEQLRDVDDRARRISYSLIESPIPNLESHTATITVTPDGDAAHVTWAVDVVPDELLAVFTPIYEQSLEAFKAKMEV